MKDVIEAMHAQCLHGQANSREHHEQQFWSGRASALTDLMALIHHDEQVRHYTTAEVHDITQEEECREVAA